VDSIQLSLEKGNAYKIPLVRRDEITRDVREIGKVGAKPHPKTAPG
jgi:hypothetical protein